MFFTSLNRRYCDSSKNYILFKLVLRNQIASARCKNKFRGFLDSGQDSNLCTEIVQNGTLLSEYCLESEENPIKLYKKEKKE